MTVCDFVRHCTSTCELWIMTAVFRYEFVSLASDEDDGAGNRIQLDYDVVFYNVKARFNNISMLTDHSSWTRMQPLQFKTSLFYPAFIIIHLWRRTLKTVKATSSPPGSLLPTETPMRSKLKWELPILTCCKLTVNICPDWVRLGLPRGGDCKELWVLGRQWQRRSDGKVRSQDWAQHTRPLRSEGPRNFQRCLRDHQHEPGDPPWVWHLGNVGRRRCALLWRSCRCLWRGLPSRWHRGDPVLRGKTYSTWPNYLKLGWVSNCETWSNVTLRSIRFDCSKKKMAHSWPFEHRGIKGRLQCGQWGNLENWKAFYRNLLRSTSPSRSPWRSPFKREQLCMRRAGCTSLEWTWCPGKWTSTTCLKHPPIPLSC